MVSAPVPHSVDPKRKSISWGIPVALLAVAVLIVATTEYPFKPATRAAAALPDGKTYNVPLNKGADHLYRIDRPSLGANPVAIEVTYYTGRPYPNAGTFDAHPFLITRFAGEHGKVFEPDLPLGNFGCSQGQITTQVIEIGHIINAGGSPVAFGVRTAKYQDIIIQKVELVMPEPEPEDPYE